MSLDFELKCSCDPLYFKSCIRFIKENIGRGLTEFEWNERLDNYMLENLPEGHRCRWRHEKKERI